MLRTTLLLVLIVAAVGRRPVGRRGRERLEEDEEESSGRGSIPGTPGLDYPVLSAVPRTSFSCHTRPEGFYADPESRCQVFHICSVKTGAMSQQSFLCPNGTLFNSRVNICDWWNRVRCDKSTAYQRPQEESTEGRSFQTSEDPYFGTGRSTERNLFRGFSEIPGNGQYEGFNSVENRQENLPTEDIARQRHHDDVEKDSPSHHNKFESAYFANSLTTELSSNVDVSPDGFGSDDLKELTGSSRSSEISIKPRVHFTHSLKSTSNTPLHSLNTIIQVARDSSLLSSFTNSPYSQDSKGTGGKSDRYAFNRKKNPVQRFVVDGVLPQYGNFDGTGTGHGPSDDDRLHSEDRKGLGEDGIDSDLINPHDLGGEEGGKTFSNEADITSTIQASFNDHTIRHNINNNFDVVNKNNNNNNGLSSQELDKKDDGNDGVSSTDTSTSGEVGYDYSNPTDESISSNARNNSNSLFVNVGSSVGSPFEIKSTNSGKNTPSVVRVSTGYSFTPNNEKNKYLGYPKQIKVNSSFSVESQFTTATPVTKPETTVSTNLFTPNLDTSRTPETDFPEQQPFLDSQENGDSQDFGIGNGDQNSDFGDGNISQSEEGVSNSGEIKYDNRFVVNDFSSFSQFNDEDQIYNNSGPALNTFENSEKPQFTPNIPHDYLSPTTEQTFTSGINQENIPSISNFDSSQTFNGNSGLNGFQTPQSQYLPSTTEANVFPNFPNFGEENVQPPKTVSKPPASAVNIFQETQREDQPNYDVNYKIGKPPGNGVSSNPSLTQFSTPKPSGNEELFPTITQNQPSSGPIGSNYFSGIPYPQISGHFITQAPPPARVIPSTQSQKDKDTLALFDFDEILSVETPPQGRPMEQTLLTSKHPYTPTVPPFTRPPTKFTGAGGSSPTTPPIADTKFVPSTGSNTPPLFNPSEPPPTLPPSTEVFPSMNFRQPFPYNMIFFGSHPQYENSHLALPVFPPHSAFYSLDPRLSFGTIQQTVLPPVTYGVHPQPTVNTKIKQVTSNQGVRGKQDYDEIVKESIGTVGYKGTTNQFSFPQTIDSTTPSNSAFSNEATKQANEFLGFTGSTISVSPSVEAYSESTTLGPSSSFNDNPDSSTIGATSSSGVNSNVFSSSRENLSPTTQSSLVSSKGSTYSEDKITPHAKVNNKNTQSTLSFTGFSTPKPFLGVSHQQSYLPPQLQSTILPDYTHVGKQLFRPMDLVSINNLHKTADLSSIHSINYAEIVKSISFSFDSPEGRERFELARSRGLFER